MKLFTRLRNHKALRYTGLALTVAVALLAAAIVASVTVDLGPAVRAAAEREGSKYIERPLHIGSLGIHLLSGKVRVENLTIDGVRANDRPFFTARRIDVGLDWLPAMARKPDITIASVEMTDWQMLVEKWDGGHIFPRFTRDDDQPKKPRPFSVTLRSLRAHRRPEIDGDRRDDCGGQQRHGHRERQAGVAERLASAQPGEQFH